MAEAGEGGPWEPVHTVDNFWDRPRSGVADFGGAPHFYDCIFDDDADDWTDRYVLGPLPSTAFATVMEHWALLERWRNALDRGDVTVKSAPVFPEDRSLYTQLRAEIDEVREATCAAGPSFEARGLFRRSDHDERRQRPGGVMAKWTVRWTKPD